MLSMKNTKISASRWFLRSFLLYDGLVIANHEETFRFIAFQNTENEKSKFIQLINFGNKKNIQNINKNSI